MKHYVKLDYERKICPKCGQNTLYLQPYEAWNSISRLDNETYICPDCGTLEALETLMTGSPAPKSRWALPHAPSQPIQCTQITQPECEV